ncbi:MAG TPA: asparagine synthase-related protein [Acidimicrobiales bacterium]|nr:asparagine synthase-related protein [Acidimicrobiales bacterium]
MTPLETAAGVPLGAEPGVVTLVRERSQPSARHALEEAMKRALQQSPCVVSFSGGRDSSATLALAAYVARRDGLPLPIPVTFRFPEIPSTHETEWQELVIRHVGLDEWERIDLTDELDLLGDTATAGLLKHGVGWPPNAYLHVPIFRVARGGCVVTGFDGDGLFGDWRWCHAQAALHGRTAFAAKDLVRIGLAFAPPAIRLSSIKRRPYFVPNWLQPDARQEFTRAILNRAAGEPRRWDRRVEWHANSRALFVAMSNLGLIAADYEVRVEHPLLDPDFLSALAAEGGAVGFGDRTSSMAHLFSDLLPVQSISRSTKAEFGGAVWREGARHFVDTWDGTGVDPSLVDADRLRAAWSADNPVIHSWSLLHAAWLATQLK